MINNYKISPNSGIKKIKLTSMLIKTDKNNMFFIVFLYILVKKLLIFIIKGLNYIYKNFLNNFVYLKLIFKNVNFKEYLKKFFVKLNISIIIAFIYNAIIEILQVKDMYIYYKYY